MSKTHTPSKYISRTDYQNLIEGNCSIEITSDTIFGITYENNGIKIENNNGTIINTNNEINGNPNQWLVVGGVVVGLATVGAVIWFSKGKIVPAQQIGSATGEIIGGETAKQLIGQYLDKMAAFLITTIASMQDVEAKTFEIVDNNIWATITSRFKTTIQTIKSANAWLDNPQTSNENFTLIENTQQLCIPESALRGSVSYDESFETVRDTYTGEKSPSDLINYEIPEDSEFYVPQGGESQEITYQYTQAPAVDAKALTMQILSGLSIVTNGQVLMYLQYPQLFPQANEYMKENFCKVLPDEYLKASPKKKQQILKIIGSNFYYKDKKVSVELTSVFDLLIKNQFFNNGGDDGYRTLRKHKILTHKYSFNKALRQK